MDLSSLLLCFLKVLTQSCKRFSVRNTHFGTFLCNCRLRSHPDDVIHIHIIAKQNLVKAKEAEIRMFVQERSNDLRKLETSKRAEILNEIRQELRKRAAAEGFEFVFDSSGKTMNDQPQLLVYPERSDITQSVIRELNRTRSVPAKK